MPQDLPTATDLLEVVALLLEREVVPATESGLRFRARVAANVLRIVAREIALGEGYLREEVKALAATLDRAEPAAATLKDLSDHALLLNRELCERIRIGAAAESGSRAQLLDTLRRIVENKLEVANPGYLEADRRLHSVHR